MTPLRKKTLGPLHKRLIYLVSAVLWLSGTAWILFYYWMQTQDGPNFQFQSARADLMKIHGASAMAFLIILGTALYHIQPGWKTKRQRTSGISLLSLCGVLIATGWGLYYAGGERGRELISAIHWILGLLMPAIIFFHVWRVIRSREKSRLVPKGGQKKT